MTDTAYFHDLAPRQQLIDLMHKYAQVKGLPYGESWQELDRLYYQRHGIKISILRWIYCRDHQIALTIPAFLETVNRLDLALELAHEMTGHMMLAERIL